MIDTLRELDQHIFIFFNGFHNEFFDVLMYWITYKYTWFPFYLVLILVVVRRYGWQGALMMLAVLIAVGLADQATSGFMKPYFGRLRPCYNPDLTGLVHVVAGCGGRFGFASAHAATTFALATSLYLMMRGWTHNFVYLYIWSFIVSYSRIYVGVHYPADLLVGAAIGSAIGWLVYLLYVWITNKVFGYPVQTRYIEDKRKGI